MLRRILMVLVLVIMVAVPIEIVSWVADRMLQRAELLWSPVDPAGYEAIRESRDPLLGWPGRSNQSSEEREADGTRRTPDFPGADRKRPCVAVFGDSFTWGDEVQASDSYPAVLGRALNCWVENFGTPGYGTDQAFLRYRDRVETRAPVVILAHYSGDILRNVNRYRGFLTNNGYGFKPRFLYRDGHLELLPLPDLSVEEFAELANHPEMISDDYFVPGGESGIARMRFPYTLTALSVLGQYRMQARLHGEPATVRFYSEANSSGALDVTTAIMLEFARVAQERREAPILVVIPDEKDLLEVRAGRQLPYAPLVERLRAAGIETPDIAAAAFEVLGSREPCALYSHCGGGHFNPEGYAMVAHALLPWVEKSLGRKGPANAE